MADQAGADRGPWPAPRGNGANDRTSRVALSGKGQVRWRADLPFLHLTGISVGASGMCFVTSADGILALDGPVVSWSVDAGGARGCLLLDDGLLVVAEDAGLIVREQATGAKVSVITEAVVSDPVPLPNGLLVFLASAGHRTVLRATTPAGQVRWEVPVNTWLVDPPLVCHDRVIVMTDTMVCAFDEDGGALWSAGLREFRQAPGTVTRPMEPGTVHGPVVGLRHGNVLVPVLCDEVIGYLVVDPGRGEVRAIPAHLRPGAPVIPLYDRETELLVMPGRPDTDQYGDPHPVLTVVDAGTGATVLRHPLPGEIAGMVAGANGMVAVAGSPSWDRWSKYHGWPGYDLRKQCYVHFLDKDGLRAEWKPGKPVTGPLAVGVDGAVLVHVSGELVSLG